MITPSPELKAWLHSLPAYGQLVYGRPVTQTQCVGCGKLAIAGLTTWTIASNGLCPTCRKIREPHRDVIHLFKPLRVK